MQTRRWNWPLWIGLLLSIAAFMSYFTVFARWPITRDVPWVNLLLFLIASALLVSGVRRGRKVVAVPVMIAGLVIFAFFAVTMFIGARRLPASQHAPQVGQKAPDFTLLDSSRKPVSLSQLIASSPRGVILIFYRGYW